jgi:hypothetical protein
VCPFTQALKEHSTTFKYVLTINNDRPRPFLFLLVESCWLAAAAAAAARNILRHSPLTSLLIDLQMLANLTGNSLRHWASIRAGSSSKLCCYRMVCQAATPAVQQTAAPRVLDQQSGPEVLQQLDTIIFDCDGKPCAATR